MGIRFASAACAIGVGLLALFWEGEPVYRARFPGYAKLPNGFAPIPRIHVDDEALREVLLRHVLERSPLIITGLEMNLTWDDLKDPERCGAMPVDFRSHKFEAARSQLLCKPYSISFSIGFAGNGLEF